MMVAQKMQKRASLLWGGAEVPGDASGEETTENGGQEAGDLPQPSIYRVTFSAASFSICLQPFLVVQSWGPFRISKVSLGLAVFCQWSDSGNSR